MNMSPQLEWLPEHADWRERLKTVHKAGQPDWAALVALASSRLDFTRTSALDTLLRKLLPKGPPADLQTLPVRLAVLGSSTLTHLPPAIRVAGLRRGLWIETFEGDYGQYLQELLDPRSALYAFKPTAILFAFDARHLTGGFNVAQGKAEADAATDAAMARVKQCWTLAQQKLGCVVLQQTVLPCLPTLVGENEQRAPGSPAMAVETLNARLNEAAEEHKVDLVRVHAHVARDGVRAWHDPACWHHAKQEVSGGAAAMYGDLVGRLLAAQQGRSAKCLVLDLDNTLWGGVIGDDGLEGIILGQNSALGEGFVAVQTYAKQLGERGVILAVCSKNDEANALVPFGGHPEMVLQRSDIAAFVANWSDKATNIRAIAQRLNIGLDAIVFLDDNPFERELVRQELPMVSVPEVSEDPSLVPDILAAAGYFEAVSITADDLARTEQYRLNQAREALKESTTDLEGYLKSLEMRLVWQPFDPVGLQRITQLTNKTNQFNLTTRRKTEADMQAIIDDPDSFGLQLRLLDRFGDNGMISVVIGRKIADGAVDIDTWLMSCRVLGRNVEEATLNIVAGEAIRLGAKTLIGRYISTAKNGMVREHYSKLGFSFEREDEEGAIYVLDLTRFEPHTTFILIESGDQ
jgi:FkbH-like protein